MFGFVSKKRLYAEIQRLYKAEDTANAHNEKNLYFRMGCANVCTALCSRLKLPQPHKGE